MQTHSKWKWLALFGFVVGCGSASSTAPASATEPAHPSRDADTTWHVRQKFCDGREIAMKADENYRIDSTYLVAFEHISEDSNTICKAGNVFQKTVWEQKASREAAYERSTLKAVARKLTCRDKHSEWASEDVEPITGVWSGLTEAVVIGSSDIHQLTLQLEGHGHCPRAVMELRLHR